MERCSWCLGTEEMKRYHDEEWGVPLHDDQKQFEFICLEVLQCGLNWDMMIRKRQIFRRCFEGFDPARVAAYGEAEIERILSTEGMIRSRRKVEAIIGNARCLLALQREHGSFSAWLWGLAGGAPILYAGHQRGGLPSQNGLSRRISAELKRRGFRYLGPVTVYSHLQACGVINDHAETCFCRGALLQRYPAVRRRRDAEG